MDLSGYFHSDTEGYLSDHYCFRDLVTEVGIRVADALLK